MGRIYGTKTSTINALHLLFQNALPVIKLVLQNHIQLISLLNNKKTSIIKHALTESDILFCTIINKTVNKGSNFSSLALQ